MLRSVKEKRRGGSVMECPGRGADGETTGGARCCSNTNKHSVSEAGDMWETCGFKEAVYLKGWW